MIVTKKNILITAGLIWLCTFFITAQETVDVQTHLKISELDSSGAPQLFKRDILFTYTEDRFIRFVGIAFEHESFTKIHPLIKNANNIFFIIYSPPPENTYLTYKYIVDGLWIQDPKNNQYKQIDHEIKLSQITIPKQESVFIESPLIDENGYVKFIYKGSTDKNIFLSGSFNRWDPFMHRMEEDLSLPGYYSLTLKIGKGEYLYYYIINGSIITDPDNPNKAVGPDDNNVSRFVIN